MKCSNCKFYTKSKVYGNGCSCRGNKPCDIKRKITKKSYKKKYKV